VEVAGLPYIRLQGSFSPVTIIVFLAWRQRAVMVNQKHCSCSTCYRPYALPVTQPTGVKALKAPSKVFRTGNYSGSEVETACR